MVVDGGLEPRRHQVTSCGGAPSPCGTTARSRGRRATASGCGCRTGPTPSSPSSRPPRSGRTSSASTPATVSRADVVHVLRSGPAVVLVAHGFPKPRPRRDAARRRLRGRGSVAPSVGVIVVLSRPGDRHRRGRSMTWALARGRRHCPRPVPWTRRCCRAHRTRSPWRSRRPARPMPKLAAHLRQRGRRARLPRCRGRPLGRLSGSALVVFPPSGVFGYVPAMTAIAAGGAALLEPVFDTGLVLAAHGRVCRDPPGSGADDVAGRLTAQRRWPGRSRCMAHAADRRLYGNSMQVSAWAGGRDRHPALGIYGSKARCSR
ncbi:hypothetical protein HBB16_16010 [Pseudonocardia sp. MCCB 268]|nr:hypothetical protein [Pseudonocardia cytotoxica]